MTNAKITANIIRLVHDDTTSNIQEVDMEIEKIEYKLVNLLLKKIKLETLQHLERLIPNEVAIEKKGSGNGNKETTPTQSKQESID